MRSGWFWGTEMWADYLAEYAEHHPECLHEFRTSPLDPEHELYFDFPSESTDRRVSQEESVAQAQFKGQWDVSHHQSQVIDLHTHQWSDLRKSYHALIHRAEERYRFEVVSDCTMYKSLHILANGFQPRNNMTYEFQRRWLDLGCGIMVGAMDRETDACVAIAYWILYEGHAYYASGPSTMANVMHAVLWHSFKILKARGIHLVELGQVDGATEKERNIGKFKAGFGGESVPFTIVRRTT